MENIKQPETRTMEQQGHGETDQQAGPRRLDNESLIRKLSKTVLHASEKGHQSLFKIMTADNAEKIATLIKEKLIFYENKEGSPQQILLDNQIANLFPKDFFENPTQWIESQKNIYRREGGLPEGKTVEELLNAPYDISKVKEFTLGSKESKINIVSKRLEAVQLEEITLARRAWEAGIPTPKVVGEIIDRNNFYVLFEKIEGINLLELEAKFLRELRALDISTPMCYLTSEVEFWRFFDNEKKNAFSPEDVNKLYLEWGRNKDLIRVNLILREIENFIDTFINASWIDYKYSSQISEFSRNLALKSAWANDRSLIEKKLHERLEKFSDDEISRAWQYLGFDNANDGLNYFITKFWSTTDYPEATKAFGKERHRFSILSDATTKFNNQMRVEIERMFYKKKLGFDLFNGKGDLEILCRDKNIEHKDFADRNILIAWDHWDEKPFIKEGEKEPKLYVVDWEPKPKSHS